ncbi:hypothetical protein [Aurantiacibacter spongiae]|uniref:DUF3617 family protein n=1 Tax=Aurantiacibacter spongiae TaxID=2488860 RepID=A0A3N5CXY9_9SPHN|nr:hypothetical protein [Aurantiacibacter spongiae]RPF72500.1 hypothetical protein EG799_13345 [Aurantiacibacter spongiae]
MKHALLALPFTVTLAACGGSKGAPPDAATTGEAAPTPGPSMTAHGVSPAPGAPAPALAHEAIGDYGISKGVYSSDRCPPALASLKTFDGTGFNSRNSVDCRFTHTSREGDTYRGSQTCTDTYSNDERTDDLALTVRSRTRFTLTDEYGTQTYDLCPDERLADWQPSAG